MTTRVRGIVLGVVQCALVLSIAGKYAWDRERLPRVWVRTVVVDPNLPLRGRYLALRLEVMPAGALVNYGPAKLSAENGQLVARAASEGRAGDASADGVGVERNRTVLCARALGRPVS